MNGLKRLDEVCDLEMGQSPNSSSYNEERRGIPFFQGNADFGNMYPETRIWCDKPTKIVEAGTLLISVRAPIGVLNFAKEKSCIGRGLAGIVAKESVDLKYIYYCLKHKHKELNNKGTGSTFKAIGKNALGETLIKILPLDKQCECILALDKVSAIINKYETVLSELDILIKARFVEMFGDPEYNDKDWEIRKLADLCKIGSSKRIYQNEQSSDGIPFWRISNLVAKMDTGIADSELFIPEARYDELKLAGLVPKSGDILVTSRGTLGRCYIIAENDKFYFQDGMISWLSQFDKNITALYLQYLFMMRGIRKQIDSMQAGSTVAYLSINMLKKLDIMVPDRVLQEQFADFVHQVNKSKTAIQKSLDETQLLFDSLMQQYFG